LFWVGVGTETQFTLPYLWGTAFQVANIRFTKELLERNTFLTLRQPAQIIYEYGSFLQRQMEHFIIPHHPRVASIHEN